MRSQGVLPGMLWVTLQASCGARSHEPKVVRAVGGNTGGPGGELAGRDETGGGLDRPELLPESPFLLPALAEPLLHLIDISRGLRIALRSSGSRLTDLSWVPERDRSTAPWAYFSSRDRGKSVHRMVLSFVFDGALGRPGGQVDTCVRGAIGGRFGSGQGT